MSKSCSRSVESSQLECLARLARTRSGAPDLARLAVGQLTADASVSASSPGRQVAHFAIFLTKMGATVQLA